MAEALALAALNTIASDALGKLKDMTVSAAKEEAKLLWNVYEEVERLSATSKMIQTVLEDAEEKQITQKSVRLWLEDLKYVTYDAEDVLEEFSMEASRGAIGQEESSKGGVAALIHWMKLVCDCLLPGSTTSPHPILFIHDTARKIKDIRKNLDKINTDRKQFNLQESSGTSSPRPFTSRRMFPEKREETSSFLSDEPVGREEEMNIIINKLLGPIVDSEPSSSSGGRGKVSLVAVVGMAGIGKTTLAQAVFNDGRVNENQFSLRKWVFVGETFDAKRIIKEILGEKEDNQSSQNLTDKLVEKLKGCKFLIVLDDVWSENSMEWDQLSVPLTQEGNEGKVLITTRIKEVVNCINIHCLDPLKLWPLSDTLCQSIFEKQAFMDKNPDSHPILREIGEKIVKKLGGVPLAARVVGGSLRHTSDEKKWRSVLDHEKWRTPGDKNKIFSALRWSYYHLPSHLRKCFAFCSVFPKDSVFHKPTLVQMWMALNYIQPLGDMQMEDTGSDYFDDLVDRSFFQYIDERYVMHDLMHDLAESISLNECLRIEKGRMSNKNPEKEKVLHLWSYHYKSDQIEYQTMHTYTRLRTLLGRFSLSPDLLVNLKRIRVLAFGWNSNQEFSKELVDSICELKHLRYLDLSSIKINSLPAKFCSLYNLQTLKVDFVELPKGMCNLTSLRCLEADGHLISEIDGLGKLISLQEIKKYFIVFRNGRSNIGELGNLNLLRRRLEIRNLENVVSGEEARQAKLQDKLSLDELRLSWDLRMDAQLDEDVLEALHPPPNLKKLTIFNNPGTKYPSWMQVTRLPQYLVRVELIGCRNWEALPPLGHLRHLIYLDVTGLESIKRVSPEFYGIGKDHVPFPSLETLEFWGMTEWEEWVGVEQGQAAFPSLRKVIIYNCPKLRKLPRLPQTLTELELDMVGLADLSSINNIYASLKYLEIIYCPELTSLSGDGSVNLPSLTSLEIVRCPEITTLGLQHVPALKEMNIKNCDKLLSLWGMCNLTEGKVELITSLSGSGSVNLPSLTSLKIEKCPEITTLGLQHVPALEKMKIENCDKLLSLWGEEGKVELTSLTSLMIDGCNELLSICGGEEGKNIVELPSLLTLEIIGCPKITTLGLQRVPALVALSIYGCGQLLSVLGLDHPRSTTSLAGLHIYSCERLTTVGLSPNRVMSLKGLEILECPALVSSFWDHYDFEEREGSGSSTGSSSPPSSLPFLEEVHTDKGALLAWLLKHDLPSLDEMYIVSCNDDLIPLLSDEQGCKFAHLTSLLKLVFDKCDNLISLPEDSLPLNLRRLEIRRCSALQSLPVGLLELTSLRELIIEDCPQIQSLSSRNLPTSLRYFKIRGCPKLEEWCRAEGVHFISWPYEANSSDTD